MLDFLNITIIEGMETPLGVKSNPSVPLAYEGILRFLNRLDRKSVQNFGLRLKITLFGKTLSPRVFCQYILPKIYRPKKERDMSYIKELYQKDWEIVKTNLAL